jgi:cell division protein FtsB
MTEEKTTAPFEGKKTKATPGYLEIIVITIVIVLGAIWGYDQFLAQKILTFDLKGYLREQTALIKAGEMTEEQFKENLNKTETILNAEAKKSNHVILLKDVVVRNGNEISPK